MKQTPTNARVPTDIKIEDLGNGKARIMMEVSLAGNMMDIEEQLQEALNYAGTQVMAEALEQHDMDGDTLFLNRGDGPAKANTPKRTKPVSGKRK
jgi:hypothetical protein